MRSLVPASRLAQWFPKCALGTPRGLWCPFRGSMSWKLLLKYTNMALTGVAQWIGCHPANQNVQFLFQFPVRAHAWVEGQVPSWEHVRSNHTLMFLFLSPSLPLSLEINKYMCECVYTHSHTLIGYFPSFALILTWVYSGFSRGIGWSWG